jgi:hypothetical protein
MTKTYDRFETKGPALQKYFYSKALVRLRNTKRIRHAFYKHLSVTKTFVNYYKKDKGHA